MEELNGLGKVFLASPQTGETKEIRNVHDVDWMPPTEETVLNINERIEEIVESFKTLRETLKFSFMVSKRLSVAMKQIFGICQPPRYHRTGIRPKRSHTRQKQRLTRLQRRQRRQRRH